MLAGYPWHTGRLSHYRIRGIGQLKDWYTVEESYLNLIDGPLSTWRPLPPSAVPNCLAVSVCRGDVTEDYREQEIENVMEELGIFDNEMDTGDPRWLTPARFACPCLPHIRQKMAEQFSHPFVIFFLVWENTLLKEHRWVVTMTNTWVIIASKFVFQDLYYREVLIYFFWRLQPGVGIHC